MTNWRQNFRNNRRKHDRVRTDMQVTVRVASGVSRVWRRPFAGRALDYNRFGMAFVSPVRLRPGTVLNLDLISPHMVLKGVEAEVVRGSRLQRNWRVGIRFYRRLAEFNDSRPGAPLPVLTGLEESLIPST